MKQVTVISGKGGTGKTSLTASLAALTGRCVLADCDVDAPDLHLILEPFARTSGDFVGGKKARIEPAACTGCGRCETVCRFEAVGPAGNGNADGATVTWQVDPLACEGCGACLPVCPSAAITLQPAVAGRWFISTTRLGPMVHARMGIAAENSGRLVSVLRTKAREVAQDEGLDLVLIDGPPGIGCPVISSMAGTDLVLAVTEPSCSALHDLARAADLAAHFGTPMIVCVNKWDLAPDLTDRIEAEMSARGVGLAGRIRYDPAVTAAQVRQLTVIEHAASGGVGDDIREIWAAVAARVKEPVDERMYPNGVRMFER